MNFKEKEIQLISHMYPKSGYTLTDTYCSYDAIHHTLNHLVEVKVRDFDEAFFNKQYNGQFIIEVDKYNRLKKESTRIGYTLLYCFGFTNYLTGKLTSYIALDLTETDLSTLPIQNLLCPQTTHFDRTLYIEKPCYIIPNEVVGESNIHRRKIRTNEKS